MTKKPEADYTDEEARRRFESAVDAALNTPPMHRESKKPPAKTVKKKKDKAAR